MESLLYGGLSHGKSNFFLQRSFVVTYLVQYSKTTMNLFQQQQISFKTNPKLLVQRSISSDNSHFLLLQISHSAVLFGLRLLPRKDLISVRW